MKTKSNLQSAKLTRRSLLGQGTAVATLAAAAPASAFGMSALPARAPNSQAAGAGGLQLTGEQANLLDEMIQRGCHFFWDHSDPTTGQTRDRAALVGKPSNIASIAATGFALSALCIAAEYRYLPAADVEQRVLNTLTFLADRCENVHGFFYHFIDMQTGERAFHCELSSIDTGLLLCGVLTAKQYFSNEKIKALATKIYERVEWDWMLDSGPTMSMGWFPDRGFLNARWNMQAEQMAVNLMAMGSPTHPVPATLWNAIHRQKQEYGGIQFLGDDAPIFIHQFAQAYVDFRGVRDDFANWFANSISATRAHQLFCLTLGGKFPSYNQDFWGISASDGEKGYSVWGGPPATPNIDGTLVPNAVAGSLPFLPEECLHVLLSTKRQFGEHAWTKYGFVDAWRPAMNGKAAWFAPDILGIDQGISVVMAENLRSGFVWRQFMKNPEIRHAMDLANFHTDAGPNLQML